MSVRILTGDCRQVLKTLPDESIHCCVTSPPYLGLRDYQTAKWEGGEPGCDHATYRSTGSSTLKNDGRPNPGACNYDKSVVVPYRSECGKCGARRVDSQIGLEPTPDAYVAEMVAVFREVRRVLRKDGTVWLNLGDSYASGGRADYGSFSADSKQATHSAIKSSRRPPQPDGLKPKDLIGIPWRVAFALQADGWWLRQDIVWSKPNPMPESVTDRCTKSHEMIFLLTKAERYYFDAAAIAEVSGDPRVGSEHGGCSDKITDDDGVFDHKTRKGLMRIRSYESTRNKRSVWHVATQPFSEAHFATFPPALIEPCILAGCPAKACAKCGAPWGRETEYGRVLSTGGSDKGARATNLDRVSPRVKTKPSSSYVTGNMVQREKVTLGFSPSCSCNADTVPGTVLDPFGGAGTTGLVADRLQRNAILIELNPEYAAMARRRIAGDAPLFAEAAE